MKTTNLNLKAKGLKVGLIVPHIFMHREILPQVIFSPAKLALDLTDGLQEEGATVTLFTPGPVETKAQNITADLSYFEKELSLRGDTYLDLLKKHPFTFVTLARQVQSEIIARAFVMANNGELDIVHIYTNEEDIALPFAALCNKPVVFTHHDPFNFLVKYKNVFPKYKSLNWISMSLAQRRGMPAGTNWAGNIYHGLPKGQLEPNLSPEGGYIAYLGRIIEPKGVHLAIESAKKAGVKLKIAGKHYAGHKKDNYWQEYILPELDGSRIEYVGHIKSNAEKQNFLGNAAALIAPSTFEEPFGITLIEALACGTPVIGLDSGAIPEIIKNGETGVLVNKTIRQGQLDQPAIVAGLANAIKSIGQINRSSCRQDFEARFTSSRMCREHMELYLRANPHLSVDSESQAAA